ncbi:C2H2-type zinc finger protein [Aspergillus lucknowensis]|uniref:C2H2-type domain-containing protein n=1 Tax=Aspergillus lucknowensis TaxID=176173 RepID=A0ABR4LFL1_9EURO
MPQTPDLLHAFPPSTFHLLPSHPPFQACELLIPRTIPPLQDHHLVPLTMWGYTGYSSDDDESDVHQPWYECEVCTRTFRTQNACNQHMDAVGHWAPRYECETCTKTFCSSNAANQHMNSVGHWAPKIPCETCNSKFHTQSAADQHMKAKAHYRNYCKSCDRRFQNANNLQMHLNSKIHRGRNIYCPFCKVGYTAASGLSHHLNSPVHKQRVYHCPNRGCAKPFTALAGLFNHLESESCSFMRFDRVQQHVGSVLQGNRLISFS